MEHSWQSEYEFRPIPIDLHRHWGLYVIRCGSPWALTGVISIRSRARIDGTYAAVFKEWYTQVRHVSTGYERTSLGPGWYPDALMLQRPAHLFTGFPFSIPDVYNDIPGPASPATTGSAPPSCRGRITDLGPRCCVGELA